MKLDSTQIAEDLKDIEVALTHALTYPKKSIIGEKAYNAAHKEIQDALTKLSRVKRTIDGSVIGGFTTRSPR